jgi:hypothetical protein
MDRKAVIICSPGGTRKLDFLKGVYPDANNYYSFLRSKSGGQWKKDEILVLLDPDSKQYRIKLQK